MNVIPAIDIAGGRCVRLHQGRFDRETVYAADPAEIVARFRQTGASVLHVVDLDGARGGSVQNRRAVAAVIKRWDGIVQVGGGLRQRDDLEKWFDCGVTRCVVGSVAAREPQLVAEWLKYFDSEQVVVALDVDSRDGEALPLATDGWEKRSRAGIFAAVASLTGFGIRHVLCTDISRDGALNGPNVALYRRLLQQFPQIQLQASGGVARLNDLYELSQTGAAAAIVGRALLENKISDEELSLFLRNG